ncbi:host attachment protein [Pararhizobium sp. LjRoot235]|uniref:host attachment protein n=1 Tax=Pararhizobium sp. LjRoot235 TaxID=3342291 RepID=UPI003ECDE595
MSTTRIPHNGWVLVCDGAKALILRNEGDTERLNLIPVDVASEHQPPTRDLGTDRQGRVYQSQGGARSATQETDWHDHAEEVFLSQIAEKLDGLIRDSDFTNLVLVAPPRVLGMLRKCLRPSARGTVTAEVAKDLVKFPIPEIEHYLSE